jgi:hypothetical protein
MDVLEKPTVDNIPTETETIPVEAEVESSEAKEESKVKAEEGKTEEAKTEEKKPAEPKRSNHDDRRWHKLLQERAEYKAKVELYEQLQRQSQSKPGSERPARENYSNDEDYDDALTDWKLEQKLEPMQRKIIEQHQAQQIEQAWEDKLSKAKAEYSDFDSVIEESNDIPVTPIMAQAIKTSDLGADIAYFLGKDPEYATKIARMDSISAIREIGRIESYVEYEKTQKAKPAQVSKAPAPITPPKAGTTQGPKNLEDMSPAEYMAYRNKQEFDKRKRR